MLGTPVMPITVYSRLPVVQYGCRVVYFGEWDANGDYIDMYCNDWLPQRQGGLTGWQTWAQPLGWPLSHQVC